MFHFSIRVLVCQLVKSSFRELSGAVSTAWHKHDCTDRSCDLRCLLLLLSDAYGSSCGFRPSGPILASLQPICADLPSKNMKIYSSCTVPNSFLPEARDGARLDDDRSESVDTVPHFVDIRDEDLALNKAYVGNRFGFTKELKNIFDRRKRITLYFESRFKLKSTQSQL